MSLKVKLISIISLFMLTLGILIIGVFAATQTINLKGNVNFNIEDTTLYVKDIRLQTELTGEPETIDNFMPGFVNTDFTLNLGTIVSTSGSVNVYFDFINTTDNIYAATASGGNGVVLTTNGIINGDLISLEDIASYESSSGTVTLTINSENPFSTIDLDGIEINMLEPEEISDFSFTSNGDGQTVSLTAYTGTGTDVKVPKSVNLASKSLGKKGYTKTFNNIEEITNYMSSAELLESLRAGFYYVDTQITERTFITDGESYINELENLPSEVLPSLFPITIEALDYEVTYDEFNSYGDLKINAFFRPLYDVILCNVQSAKFEFGSLGSYDITPKNAFELGNEISQAVNSINESFFPLKVIYPSKMDVAIAGDNFIVTDIINSAFAETDIEKIELPESLVNIGESAFSECTNLTEVIFPESLTTIANNAFSGCSALTEANLSNCINLTEIGDSAFSQCSILPTVGNLANCTKLENIGDYAFEFCNTLTGDFYIPANVSSIGISAFGNTKITTFLVDSNNQSFVSDDYGALLNKTETNLISYPCGNTSELYLAPSTIINIERKAFTNCETLMLIALINCHNLESIGDYAFSGCSALTSMDIRYSTNLSYIGDYAFARCSALESITIGTIAPPNVVVFAFENCNILNHIYVPEESVDRYKVAGGWLAYADIISAI